MECCGDVKNEWNNGLSSERPEVIRHCKACTCTYSYTKAETFKYLDHESNLADYYNLKNKMMLGVADAKEHHLAYTLLDYYLIIFILHSITCTPSDTNLRAKSLQDLCIH